MNKKITMETFIKIMKTLLITICILSFVLLLSLYIWKPNIKVKKCSDFSSYEEALADFKKGNKNLDHKTRGIIDIPCEGLYEKQ